MSFSETFIKNSVGTTLLTIALALAGVVAFRALPEAPLPAVEFPTIQVQAQLPGASPEVVAATVAAPLERSLGRIAGVQEMTSQSALGMTEIVLQFDLNRSIDGAARDVQAAINAALPLLPSGMPSYPLYRKINPADAPIMVMALTSAVLDRGQLYDLASSIIAQKISQLDGIGQVIVGGGSLPAVRVAVDPRRLAQQGLDLAQLRQALQTANVHAPTGYVVSAGRQYVLAAQDQLSRAHAYADQVIAWHQGHALRLRQVADVRRGLEDARNAGLMNGEPSVVILVFRQPGANILATVEGVKAHLAELQAALPGSAHLRLSIDRSPSIRVALQDVEISLLISVLLVVLVVFLFLRDAYATLIPSVSIPVSLLATCAALYLGGYSLDMLSLMAMTVAAGFVVDDAIVVLENIARHVDAGMPVMRAARRGTAEVTFTVLSMSLSLIAVFIPIMFMGGIMGRLFREFAITLAFAVLLSMIISLTLTPVLASRLLRPSAAAGHVAYGLPAYRRSLQWALQRPRWMLVLWLGTLLLTLFLFTVVSKGFLPPQDTGRLRGILQADQSSSFAAMNQRMQMASRIIQADPAVDKVMAFTGGKTGDASNVATFFVSLKPKSRGRGSPLQVIDRLRPRLAAISGARMYLQPMEDLRMGGRASNALYQYTLESSDLALLRRYEPRVIAALRRIPGLEDVSSDEQDHGQATRLAVDRDRLAVYGLNMAQVDDSLNSAYAQRLVSVIYGPLNQYHVVLEVPEALQRSAASLHELNMDSSTGRSVPLDSVMQVHQDWTPLSVSHQDGLAAATLSFNLAHGVALSQAVDRIHRRVADMHLPSAIEGSFQGTAKAFEQDRGSEPLLILAALAMLYIVLGILYESFLHPLTILSTLPSAGMGALLTLLFLHLQLTLIAMIGLILLIGIVKKNAIMMIDFAQQERRRGQTIRRAIELACEHRYRPIMMTTLAALLGALPLALGWGEGSEMRRPLGWTIIGGLIFSQWLTLYTTPVIYVVLETWRWRKKQA